MRVAAIVPVYNEERTVQGVLDALVSSKRINEIIVIDGGSTDNTPVILAKFKNHKNPKVKLLRILEPNGKGNAVRDASEGLKCDIVMLFDADLIGLRTDHIDRLLDPVAKDGAAMSIGLRDKQSAIGNMIMPYFPLTGGERAFRAEVFMSIRKSPLILGWGLESVMNDYCKKKKLKVAKVFMDGMDHIGVQAKKYGLMAFLKEIYDVILTKAKLVGVRYD